MSRQRGPSNNSDPGSLPSKVCTNGDREELLVEQFCAGDAEAVALVWTKFGPSFAWRLERRYKPAFSRDRCEQIALDALERAFEHREQFLQIKGSFEAWLWTITFRRAAEQLREPWFKQRRQETSLPPEKLVLIVERVAAYAGGAEHVCLTALHVRGLVERAMRVLSHRERSILSADMESPVGRAPTSELSERLSLAPSTIRWHRARGRAKLKSELLRLGYLPCSAGRALPG